MDGKLGGPLKFDGVGEGERVHQESPEEGEGQEQAEAGDRWNTGGWVKGEGTDQEARMEQATAGQAQPKGRRRPLRRKDRALVAARGVSRY